MIEMIINEVSLATCLSTILQVGTGLGTGVRRGRIPVQQVLKSVSHFRINVNTFLFSVRRVVRRGRIVKDCEKRMIPYSLNVCASEAKEFSLDESS